MTWTVNVTTRVVNPMTMTRSVNIMTRKENVLWSEPKKCDALIMWIHWRIVNGKISSLINRIARDVTSTATSTNDMAISRPYRLLAPADNPRDILILYCIDPSRFMIQDIQGCRSRPFLNFPAPDKFRLLLLSLPLPLVIPHSHTHSHTHSDSDSHSQCCGARLFSWTRSRWKGSGSGLLLFGLGVLWWQSSDNSCKTKLLT